MKTQADRDRINVRMEADERDRLRERQQRKLTNEQRCCLDHFAHLNGRRWKDALRKCWETGNYSTSDCIQVLQRLRNAANFGPSGLIRYKAS